MSDAQNKYLDGFRDWWTTHGHGSRSAITLCSGLRKINDDFFKPVTGRDLFEALDESVVRGCAVDWLTALASIINYKIENTADVTLKMRFRNNRSQLMRFIEYVDELQEYRTGASSCGGDIDVTTLPGNAMYYDRKTLVITFRRLIYVSDYFQYDEVFFPVSIVGMLFREATTAKKSLMLSMGISDAHGRALDLNKWFKLWITALVNKNILFHSEKGDYSLSAIDGVLIDSHREKAWVRVNGKDIVMMSEGHGEIHTMKVKSLSDIMLKRTQKLKDVLSHLAPVLVGLRMLTADIQTRVSGQATTGKVKGIETSVKLDKFARSANHVLRNWYCENVDWRIIAPLLPILRNDLNYIAAATKFVATSRIDNLN